MKLTEAIKVCVHSIWSGDGTHQSGLQKGGPFVGQAPEATHVILQHTTAVSAVQLVQHLSLSLSLPCSFPIDRWRKQQPHSDRNPSAETTDGREPPAPISRTNWENKPAGRMPLRVLVLTGVQRSGLLA